MRRCQTIAVGIYWQQGREEGERTWSGCGFVKDVLPRHTRNEVSCALGCVMLECVFSVAM